jgi:hypothetical protein
MPRFRHHHLGRLPARLAALTFICVLICVPALTRIGQKLQPISPISQAPSFAKNIDCPPKKVTIAPIVTIASVVLLEKDETVPAVHLAPAPDACVPHPPTTSAPIPLRAPPAILFA